MYCTRLIEVAKAENGFVVSCSVPLKPDTKKTDKMMCCCDSSCDKQYIAKDAAEVAQLITDLMPLLDMDHKTEDDFDKAFMEGSKMPTEDGMKPKMKK